MLREHASEWKIIYFLCGIPDPFVSRIHQWSVDSPRRGSVMRKEFPDMSWHLVVCWLRFQQGACVPECDGHSWSGEGGSRGSGSGKRLPLPHQSLWCHLPHVTWVQGPISIWVRSRNCGCLVTWFCYQLIAKPGNKTDTVSWPDPYKDRLSQVWGFPC